MTSAIIHSVWLQNWYRIWVQLEKSHFFLLPKTYTYISARRLTKKDEWNLRQYYAREGKKNAPRDFISKEALSKYSRAIPFPLFVREAVFFYLQLVLFLAVSFRKNTVIRPVDWRVCEGLATQHWLGGLCIFSCSPYPARGADRCGKSRGRKQFWGQDLSHTLLSGN